MTDDDADGRQQAIGPYILLEQIGEGGMAQVYLAEQSEPVQRRVALKVLKTGLDSKQMAARLESERQALALLNHPNIANVFDGGVTGDGRPFVVMEYVDGVPITEYCDANCLTTTARIRLFIDVCRAVQHAHIKGLIHRDIKPSNVLVAEIDGRPQPKVIDFGVAKATLAPLADAALQTRIGQVIGTPQYMSPEQVGVNGVDIDTRADVYSLGVVLYELLAGAPPLDLRAVRDIALPSVIREKQPPTPSTRFTGLGDECADVAAARRMSIQDLRRTLSGDLDWIAMRAIDKDRDRRYETVNALALDCQRFLDKQPVLARPPTAGYVISRFVRRNRALVAAASIAAVAVSAGAVAAAIGYLRATEAEQVARQEAETAKQVSQFLVGLFETSDPAEARGSDITTREVLDRGVQRIHQTLQDEPEIRSNLMQTMATVYTSLGEFDDAESLALQALENRRAAGSRAELIADSLDQLGAVRAQLGQVASAIALHEEALQIRQAPEVADVEGQIDTLQHLGEATYLDADIERSRDSFARALELAKSLPDPDPDLLANITGNLGVLHNVLGEFETAEALQRSTVAALDDAYGPAHPKSATARNNLAITLNRLGRSEEAATVYRDALDAYRTIYDDAHPNTANTLNNLAQLLLRMGELESAEALQRESHAMFLEIFGPDHTQVALTALTLGRILAASGKTADAEMLMRDALATQMKVLPEDHERIFITQDALAAVLIQQQQFAEARTLATSARDHFEARYGSDHWRAARASSVLADALMGLAEFEQAEKLLLEALPRVEDSLGSDHPAAESIRQSLASLYRQTGRPAIAEQYEVSASASSMN